MSDCMCQRLNAPLDAVAFDWSRKNAVVIHNRSNMVIDLCDRPHRIEPYEYYLCSPEQPNVSTGIASQRLRVVTRFDSSQHPTNQE
jgi:hypothetical protein